MDETFFDLMEECQMVLSAIVLEGTSEHSKNAAIMLSQIIQDIGRWEDMESREYDPEDPANNIVSAVIPKGELLDALEMSDLHESVINAVCSACDSAERGTLAGWELDLIESRIVKHHSIARHKKPEQKKEENEK